MTQTAQVLYTAKTATIGGREDGTSRSSDGLLDIRLSTPGSVRIGTNPEQLLAAGWSASLASAIVSVAHRLKITLPAGVRIDAEVDLNRGDDGYSLSIRFNVRVPGVEHDAARAMLDQAYASCPYSKATLGNVRIAIHLL
jgi:lipoyl-dependent peroxiredoxin